MKPKRNAAPAECNRILALFALLCVPLLFLGNEWVRIGLPVTCVALASFLFVRSRPDYVSFLCWTWFLAPIARRIIDFHTGADATVVLLTPYAVALIPAAKAIYHWRSFRSTLVLPLAVMGAAVFYGMIVGLINFDVVSVLQILVIWLAPLCFALFLCQHKSETEAIYERFQATMVAGTALTGIYGIYQYFFLPPWDARWMQGLGNVTFGIPKPMQVRVFGTMNSPQILALFLCAGIILAVRSSSSLRFLAVPTGLVALALSMARTAWVGLMIGLAYVVFRMKARQRLQFGALSALCVILFAIVLQDPEVGLTVSNRFNTLSDVSHDDSIVTRLEGHLALLENMANFPFGVGLGGQQTGSDKGPFDAMMGHGGKYVMQNDSTLAAFLISLGLFGTTLATATFFMVGVKIARLRKSHGTDVIALKGIFLLMMAEFFLDNIINGPGAFITWACIGFSLIQTADGVLGAPVSREAPIPSASSGFSESYP